MKNANGDPSKKNPVCVGPFRVFPGRLSVSRTFGDIEAKLPNFGGNPKVVIAEPEIRILQLLDEHEFVIVASDGVFDKLTNREIVKSAWDSLEDSNAQNIHQQCGLGVENILRSAINSKSLDNVTVVMICFKAFKQKFKAKQRNISRSNQFPRAEHILNVNKNFNNVPLKDEKIMNLLKGGSFVSAVENSNLNNENLFKKSMVDFKFHRNSVDNHKNSEKESEFDIKKLIKKFDTLELQKNEKKGLFNVYKR